MVADREVPRLSRVEHEILRLLITDGEQYGLAMVRRSKMLKRGTIYVTLSRMREKGYVTSRPIKEPDQAGLPRRLFKATGHGARVYRFYESWRGDPAASPAPAGG